MPFPTGGAELRVLRDDQTLVSRQASSNAPQVSITDFETAGEGRYRVRLTGSDADGDELFYTAAYTADGTEFRFVPAHWTEDGKVFEIDGADLPGSASGAVRVTVSDGIRSAQALSPPLALPDQPPSVTTAPRPTSSSRRIHSVPATATKTASSSSTSSSPASTRRSAAPRSKPAHRPTAMATSTS